MIPVDLLELLREDLEHEVKPRENLYPSSDLIGSLRHTQLSFVGAPRVTSDLVGDMRMETGTMWHKRLGQILEDAGLPVMREVRLTPWMPDGWSGIADLLFWVPEERAWVLRDLKTTKGEGIKWKVEKGMSEEHLWQVSTYWWGCYHMGLRMMDRFEVMYLPITQDYKDPIEPVTLSERPLTEEILLPVMEERWSRAREYQQSVVDREQELSDQLFKGERGYGSRLEERYVTDALAPIQPRVQKLIWEAKLKRWNVVLVPHWSAAFCPYPNELCGCSAEGTTKVGHFERVEDSELLPTTDQVRYVPRRGYEATEPEVAPVPSEIRRRFKK